jgi:hypothetical protein
VPCLCGLQASPAGPSLAKVDSEYHRSRSLLAWRLSANETLGALNLYAHLPRAYGATDRTKAVIFAAYAGIALGAAEELEGATDSLNTAVRRLENWPWSPTR